MRAQAETQSLNLRILTLVKELFRKVDFLEDSMEIANDKQPTKNLNSSRSTDG